MSDILPADILRSAANRIRKLADAAIGNDQPWRYAKGLPDDSVRTATGWEVVYGQDPANLYYIAAMHPGVGTAIAEWLEAAARDYEASVTAADQVFHDDPEGRWAFTSTGPGAPSPHALTVARQILEGEDR